MSLVDLIKVECLSVCVSHGVLKGDIESETAIAVKRTVLRVATLAHL